MADEPPDPLPICPKCHLPVREESAAYFHGKAYHRHCLPPEEAPPGTEPDAHTPVTL